MLDGAGGLWVVAIRFVVLLATIGSLGALVFARFVLPRITGPSSNRVPAMTAFAGRVAIWSTGLLVLSAVPRVVLQARALIDPGDPLWPTVTSVLETRWGMALSLQTLAALLACVALWRSTAAGSRSHLAEGAVGLLAVIPAFMGHAGSSTSLRAVSVLVDVAHVAAAGGWVGALALLTIAALRERRSAEGPALTASLIVAFHPVALVAAGTVFATGLATAWLRMGVPVGIASSSYSGLFVAKLLLAGVTGAFGAGHSKLATRRVQSLSLDSVGRTLTIECALALVVLLVTAVLAGTDPIA